MRKLDKIPEASLAEGMACYEQTPRCGLVYREILGEDWSFIRSKFIFLNLKHQAICF